MYSGLLNVLWMCLVEVLHRGVQMTRQLKLVDAGSADFLQPTIGSNNSHLQLARILQGNAYNSNNCSPWSSIPASRIQKCVVDKQLFGIKDSHIPAMLNPVPTG